MGRLKAMQNKSPRLSKSRFMAGLQCSKRLYLEAFHRELMTPPGPAQQKIFDSGNYVGELARDEFPGKVLIDPPFIMKLSKHLRKQMKPSPLEHRLSSSLPFFTRMYSFV